MLHPDHTHVLSQGRIVASGGPELAEELERTGYAGWAEEPAEGAGDRRTQGGGATAIDDPFGGPGGPATIRSPTLSAERRPSAEASRGRSAGST